MNSQGWGSISQSIKGVRAVPQLVSPFLASVQGGFFLLKKPLGRDSFRTAKLLICPLWSSLNRGGSPVSGVHEAGDASKSLAAACRANSRFCALIVMTNLLRAQLAIANQGSRTPGADALLLSTRQTDDTKLNERGKANYWGIRNGLARTTKNMRRVRLSLVPPLQPWKCLLP